jgi:hypothetical protein
MPLDEFTALAIDGLKRGDLHIPIGAVKQQYDQFEEGKIDIVNTMFNTYNTIKRG